jgi:hypothetical protein
MKYNVHIFPVVRVKVCDIEAESQVDAIKKAVANTNLDELFSQKHPTPGVENTEYAEEISHYLVDEADDPEYINSKSYQDAEHLKIIKLSDELGSPTVIIN